MMIKTWFDNLRLLAGVFTCAIIVCPFIYGLLWLAHYFNSLIPETLR